MVKQRNSFAIVMPEGWSDRIENKQCPTCGKPKIKWDRRKDWTCCSTDCTHKFRSEIIWGWGQLRKRVISRDSNKCVKCKKEYPDSGLVADHIKPIALGGEQWDEDNIQTLCIDCNKIKTKKIKQI